jgi:hypothetical protein
MPSFDPFQDQNQAPRKQGNYIGEYLRYEMRAGDYSQKIYKLTGLKTIVFGLKIKEGIFGLNDPA